jgi:hypothetical protein
LRYSSDSTSSRKLRDTTENRVQWLRQRPSV